MFEKEQALFIPVMINFIQNIKEEIEKEGLIATADEILHRLEVINESNRLTSERN